MSLNKFWVLVLGKEAWHAAVHEIGKDMTKRLNWSDHFYQLGVSSTGISGISYITYLAWVRHDPTQRAQEFGVYFCQLSFVIRRRQLQGVFYHQYFHILHVRGWAHICCQGRPSCIPVHIYDECQGHMGEAWIVSVSKFSKNNILYFLRIY